MRYLPWLLLFVALGCGTPSFLVTPVSNTNELQEDVVERGQGFFQKKIVLIEVEGMLVNARSGGFLQPTENPVSLFVQRLDQAADDPSVAAVVLRINSPGGTVTSADTMYQAVLRFKEKTHKPVIAATQEVAASGAYYVACSADKIVAHPTSVIGSIGVIFYTFDFEGTMSKIGMRAVTIKSGQFKDIGSPFRAPTTEERALMQQMVDEYYTRFVGVVQAHRPIPNPETLKLATDGRVFSGQRAVEVGLADSAGGLPDAIALAKEMAKAPNAQVVLYKRPTGYSGSIYASSPAPEPQSNVMQLNVAAMREMLPTGFYYLWEP